jgi:E3 SUMO-protein ligase RanBP2
VTIANGTPSRHNINHHNISINTRTEARPSPERLDAQLRHLVQAFNNGIHSLVEQNQNIIQELKDLKTIVQDELKKLSSKVEAAAASKQAVYDLKEEDLYAFPDDYPEELSQLNQSLPQFPPYGNFSNFRAMPGVQGTSTLTYGAPGAPGAPPAPSLLPAGAGAPLFTPPFFPGPRPPIDPLLLYQSLGYYQQGLQFNEPPTLPDFRTSGPHKGVSFTPGKNKSLFSVRVCILSVVLQLVVVCCD